MGEKGEGVVKVRIFFVTMVDICGLECAVFWGERSGDVKNSIHTKTCNGG